VVDCWGCPECVTSRSLAGDGADAPGQCEVVMTFELFLQRCLLLTYRLAAHATLNWMDDAAMLAMMFS